MSKGSNAPIVHDSRSFFDVVNKEMPGVVTIHVRACEIGRYTEKENPWKDVQDAGGISKAHVLVGKKGKVEMRRTNQDTELLRIVEYDEKKRKEYKPRGKARR